MTLLQPVLFSGGSGTRLWPLSREAYPKQFLPLVGDDTMVQATWRRVAPLASAAPIIVANEEHRFLVAEQLRQIGAPVPAIILEPVGRNTAPAIAAAALQALTGGQDPLLLVLPSDHVVRDPVAFRNAVAEVAAVAEAGALVTFGIMPGAPETGFGYIQSEQGPGPQKVLRFVEKPDQATAQSYLDAGNYYWNSGMFLFRADRYLSELKEFNPAMAAAAESALRTGYRDLDFCRLDEATWNACPSDSIDYAVMERTTHAVVVPADIGWSDVGSWSALWEVQQGDTDGNVLRGDVYVDGVKNSLVRAESRIVAVVGLDDVVVVETNDAVLVAHKDQVQRVKQIVEHLKSRERTEHLHHSKVYRPWGHYEGIDAGDRFQVKRITVKPGEKLSLQMHHHRAEHWVVVSGTALVTCGEKTTLLSENESTYIPIGMTHRLENPGKLPLHLIEVQSGSYLGEDDIVRFEDIYKRS
jgi:mannose-1-phosphate guanylyltransferase / mannose-6-phosphate isomerase